jgi:uncharacterized protein
MVKWIRTYTGRKVNPVHLQPDDINIIDIAHALHLLCRFTGHTKKFYSVAYHSYNVFSRCSPKNKPWGLLHDAAEAYMNDLASPFKNQIALAEYRRIEIRNLRVIAKAFTLPKEVPSEVWDIDCTIVNDEGRILFDKWNLPAGHVPILHSIPTLSFRKVEKLFLDSFYSLNLQ